MAITVPSASLGARLNSISGASSYNFTTGVAVAAGDFIVLAVGWFRAGASVSTVTGGGLTWTVDKQGQAGSPSADGSALISAQAPAGLASGTTITVTFTTAVDAVTIGGMVLRGVATSSPVDTTVGPVGVSPSAAGWTTGNMTVLAGSILVGAVFGETSATANAPTSPAVEAWEEQAPDGWSVVLEYRIEAGAGTFAVAGTFTAGQQSVTNGVAYKAAAAGGTDATVDLDTPDVTADAAGDAPVPVVTGDPAVAFDAKSRSHATDALGHTAASTFSWTHTPVGTPKGVLLAVTQPLGSTDEVSAVTYGGVAMARVVSQARTSTEQMRTYLYFLGSGIPTGAQTVAVTSTGTLAKQAHVFTVTTSDGSDTAVDASNSSDLGIIANPSLTVTHTGTLPSWFGLAIHGYGGAATPNLTASAVRQSNTTLGFGHDPGAATAETYYRDGNAAAGSSTYGYSTLASDDEVLAAVVIKPTAANATVTAVPADGTGGIPSPAPNADANVTAPVADATGDTPNSVAAALAEVVSPPADGTGDAPDSSVSAGANVDAPVSDASGQAPISGNEVSSEVVPPAGIAAGDAPAPTVSGSAAGTVTSPAADGTGDMPDPTVSAGASLTSPAADATGDHPDPVISAGAGVTAPAADGTGDAPVPSLSAGADVASPVADGTGAAPAPGLSAGSSVDSPVADATGTVPAPTLIPAAARIRLGETVTGIVEVSARLTGPVEPAPATGISEVSARLSGVVEPAPATGIAEVVGLTGVSEPTHSTGVDEVFSNTGILEVAI